jgi:hypothetical protein
MIPMPDHLPLNILVTGIINHLMQKRKIDEKTAFSLVYKSRLYKGLEDPKTSLWTLSSILLCDMLCEELDTGTITIPEEQ